MKSGILGWHKHKIISNIKYYSENTNSIQPFSMPYWRKKNPTKQENHRQQQRKNIIVKSNILSIIGPNWLHYEHPET